MTFPHMSLKDAAFKIVSKKILYGLDKGWENPDLDLKKKYVKTLPPAIRNTLIDSFLSDRTLSENTRLICAYLFLNENTKYFTFIQRNLLWSTKNVIIKMLLKFSREIESMDLSQFLIPIRYKEDLKNILKRNKNLESMRVRCSARRPCAIFELLFIDDIDMHDEDVKIGLQKIKYLFGLKRYNKPEMCAKVLKFLPNLQCFGNIKLGKVINHYIDTYSPNKTLKLSKICDVNTTKRTIKNFAKLCPKTKFLSIKYPGKYVVKSFHKFPLLTEIELTGFNTNELMEYLKKYGKQIRKLRLRNRCPWAKNYDKAIFYKFCPKLDQLKISCMDDYHPVENCNASFVMNIDFYSINVRRRLRNLWDHDMIM